MIDLFLKGGILMWPILLCSVISFTIFLERSFFFFSIRLKTPNLLSRIRNFYKQNKVNEALKLCESLSGPVPHILAIGIHTRNRSANDKERIVEQASAKEVRKLEKNLNVLAIIGNVSPLLGLLGTVNGMIKTFMRIQELNGRVDVSTLAGGIWEALITTAAGLSVAIPTIVFYHYFSGKVDDVVDSMKDAISELFENEKMIA